MKYFLFFLTVLFFSASVSAQSYKLNYNFEPGKTYLFREVTNTNLTQSMMGQEMKVTSNSSTVIRISGEENTGEKMTLVISLDSAVSHTKTPQMDTTMVLSDMVGKRMRVVIDQKGEVKSHEMIDSLNIEGQMLQLVQREAMQFVQLPSNEVKSGEKWIVNDRDSLNMMGGNTIITSEIEYTSAGTENKSGYNVLKMPFTAKLKIEGKGTIMGFDFFIEGSGSSTGEFYFSADKGIPVYSKVTQDYDVTMAATGEQNMIIPITQSVTTERTLIK